jgi:hypothetical protein
VCTGILQWFPKNEGRYNAKNLGVSAALYLLRAIFSKRANHLLTQARMERVEFGFFLNMNS